MERIKVRYCSRTKVFLGGAPYANIMAPELRKYAESIEPGTVGRIVLFTTSRENCN